jgi:outer membrane biosynthesis protein TonB
MAMLRGVRADLSNFAHLIGFKPKAADEPNAEKPEDEMEGDEKKPDAESEPEKTAEAPTEEPKAEGDKPDAEEDDKKPDMEDEETPAQARAAERARCRAIFAAPAAGKNPALAAHLAFDTDLSAAQAVATLGFGGAGGGGLASRMAQAPNPTLGSGGAAKSAADDTGALVSSILASAAKARGKS